MPERRGAEGDGEVLAPDDDGRVPIRVRGVGNRVRVVAAVGLERAQILEAPDVLVPVHWAAYEVDPERRSRPDARVQEPEHAPSVGQADERDRARRDLVVQRRELPRLENDVASRLPPPPPAQSP